MITEEEGRALLAKGPPMQLSGKPEHPWFHPFWCNHVRALIDGEPENVSAYDADAGWVEITHWNGEGLETTRRHGCVSLIVFGAT